MSMTDNRSSERDFEALVGYDGTTFWFEHGYHAIFEIRKADEPGVGPHPYRYAFSLHAPNGKRIMGFDNAHPVARKAGKFKRRSQHADHWHRDASDRGRPYKFETLSKLLDDFFTEVERTLQVLGVLAEPVDVQ